MSADVARWAGMFSQAVDNADELARELRGEIKACHATMQFAVSALREEARNIGMNDIVTADFLDKWADRLWKEAGS